MFKLVYAYKSNKKPGAYLYVADKNFLDELPEALVSSFGYPIFVMTIATEKYTALSGVAMTKVQEQIHETGFYLFIPPPTHSLLKAFNKTSDTE